MEAMGVCSNIRGVTLGLSLKSKPDYSAAFSPLLVHSMPNAQKLISLSAVVSKKVSSGTQIKLLTRVEQLKLLTKAEKAGLLSAAENAGLSLSSIEKLGLLSKAEEFGVFSAANQSRNPNGSPQLKPRSSGTWPSFCLHCARRLPMGGDLAGCGCSD